MAVEIRLTEPRPIIYGFFGKDAVEDSAFRHAIPKCGPLRPYKQTVMQQGWARHH
jgi:hypothetical protein